MTRFAELVGTRYPIVQAPIAPYTTPELVAAVSEAGGLGTLAAALMPPDAMRDAVGRIRSLTDRPFGVNLFAPLDPPTAEPAAVAAMQSLLARHRAELGLPEPQPPSAPPAGAFETQLAVVVDARVPVFSFTFGIPPLDAAREAGCVVLGTATTVAEAVELERAGVDAVVAQGSEAGGHRGTFRSPPPRRAEPSAGSRLGRGGALVGGLALVPQIVDAVRVPVVAAGGIMDGRGIAAALALGAEGVQLGTAFLATRESTASTAHKQAVRSAADDATVVTTSQSGRAARLIATPLVDELEESGLEPLPYPLQGQLLADVRAAAAERGRADLLFLLAGQGAGLARDVSAAELVEMLERETSEVLARLAP
jgi:nitronate monooxygenase